MIQHKTLTNFSQVSYEHANEKKMMLNKVSRFKVLIHLSGLIKISESQLIKAAFGFIFRTLAA